MRTRFDVDGCLDISRLTSLLHMSDLRSHEGKINKIIGMTIEATGLSCSIGDICSIELPNGEPPVITEVVGVSENKAYLMPYQEMDGIGYGCAVKNTGRKLCIHASDEFVGRAVNALGKPIDNGPAIYATDPVSITGVPVNPMSRPPIREVIELGIKPIDGLLTVGKGQRIGIFAGSGVGKSTLMGMIARNVKADVNVIALVGERGREVVEFMNKDLGEEGRKRSVLVVATSDQPALMRLRCAQTATAIAEYFQQKGMDVLLMMDSLTRFAIAQREVGLATGEAPIARGYTPSIYSALPKLLERSGNFEKGSITGIYTVLVEGDDTNEPIADTVRSIIDGHIVLSRKIAAKNHYPAIDVLASVSRLMNDIATPEQKDAANAMRNMMSIYKDNEDLISIGAYKPGGNRELDNAVAHMDSINGFLTQRVGDSFSYEQTTELLKETVV